MTSTQLTSIIGDVIVILGLVLNYLKTRSVGNSVAQIPAPPTPLEPPKP